MNLNKNPVPLKWIVEWWIKFHNVVNTMLWKEIIEEDDALKIFADKWRIVLNDKK